MESVVNKYNDVIKNYDKSFSIPENYAPLRIDIERGYQIQDIVDRNNFTLNRSNKITNNLNEKRVLFV